MVSAKHVGIKIYVTGPLDRAELTVHGDGLEDLAVITNRSEHAADLQKPGQIYFVHRAVGERQSNPALSERLNPGDGRTRWVHDSGAIGAGCSGTWMRSQLAASSWR